jgi:hypothetical protein
MRQNEKLRRGGNALEGSGLHFGDGENETNDEK